MSKVDQLRGVPIIDQLEIEGKVVFLRLDLNVPLKEGQIQDDTRIEAALPTIKYAMEQRAKVVVASHLGRPKTPEDRQKLSLEPVADEISRRLDIDVTLVDDPLSDAPKAILAGLKRNQLVMLENLRFYEGETKNGHDLSIAVKEYADIYINDAFGASHRSHSSIVDVAKEFEAKGVGFLMKKEIEMLDQVLEGTERPYVAILGGAKVSDKIVLIDRLIDSVDTFVIGGAMAYTFLKAKGIKVGESLVETDQLSFAKRLIERLESRDKKLLLPIDHRVVTSFSAVETLRVTETSVIDEGWMAIDIGPKSALEFAKELRSAKRVFWNGPMGVFETPEYANGTFALARAIAELDALTVIGGGDSASAAKQSGVADKFTHISTGGGASLEYLQGEPLPGLLIQRGKLF